MVNAGRILIIPQGEWTNLTNYQQLDLVTKGDVAYIARRASVGVDPSTDVQMTYWQPFGTAAKIATDEVPGLVMPDGTTITIDTTTGLIQASLRVSDLTDVALVSLASNQILKYDATTQKWVNYSISDIQTPIESMIAPLENGTTTSQAYAAGEKFVRNNVLYEALVSISQGASFASLAVNTDYKVSDDLEADIFSLKNKVGTVTTKTLAANATSVEFDVPTSGNNLIKFYSLDGSPYTAIDTSVSGKVTLTFDVADYARTISCQIAKA